MRVSGLDFPAPLITALRKDRLVVFAGAGVSMPQPAGLPGFVGLAEAIAEGTVASREAFEPVDRFLGRLKTGGTDVHARAARVLQARSPQPTALHRDLLRLYATPESVRVVTTNFDTLFEQAARDVFDAPPSAAIAPALPRATAFNGIVHVHGSLDHPRDIVLTDEDFGRAYLTEGWARRFLLDLFGSYAVLFVGYSHGDLDMTYLARALPPGSSERFALADDADGDKWRLLGIEPIGYPSHGGDDHGALAEGVKGLADYARRDMRGWNRKIGELASNPPSLDDEAADLIGDALADETRCRFFFDAATHPEWITWLERQRHLDRLFTGGEAGEGERLLARWLAGRFTLDHPSDLFALIARARVRLPPVLWHALISAVSQESESRDEGTLAKWASVLLDTAPVDANPFALLELGARCAASGLTESLLGVFDAMAAGSLVIAERPSLEGDPVVMGEVVTKSSYSPLKRLYEKCIEPLLGQVAGPLLGVAVRRLEDEHRTLSVWHGASRAWDSTSFRRSAIEPHQQDRLTHPIDVVIDAARDCLERLAGSQPEVAARWCDYLVTANPPLLRRLAVHTVAARADLGPDQKVDWLVSTIGLHDLAAHHELFRAVRAGYPDASTPRRRAIVEEILKYRSSDSDPEQRELRSAYRHFVWLEWLQRSDPECGLIAGALAAVKREHPDFQAREHPDLTHYVTVGAGTLQSPWSSEELLARKASDRLDDLLGFKGDGPLEPSRGGLLTAVQEAASREFGWGLGLADAMAESGHWDADLWPVLIRSWAAELGEDELRRVLGRLSSSELYQHHVREVAEVLSAVVSRGDEPLVPALLDGANRIATDLWDHCAQDELSSEGDDWLLRAVDHPAGVLAEYWVKSVWAWRRGQDPVPDRLGEEHSAALLSVIRDRRVSGPLGRAVLARHLDFLLDADEQWTTEHLVPLFRRDGGDDYRAVWTGLVYQGLTLRTANALGSATLKAARRMDALFADDAPREGFVEFFVGTIVWFVDDPVSEWIPAFFEGTGESAGRRLAMAVGKFLSEMNDTERKEWWNRWLKRYWENRLQGVPARLDDGEAEDMLDWLRGAGCLFPVMVEIAIRTPLKSFPRSLFHGAVRDGPWLEHPEYTGRLLVHLANQSTPQPWLSDVPELIARLTEQDLSPELQGELQELLARLGA